MVNKGLFSKMSKSAQKLFGKKNYQQTQEIESDSPIKEVELKKPIEEFKIEEIINEPKKVEEKKESLLGKLSSFVINKKTDLINKTTEIIRKTNNIIKNPVNYLFKNTKEFEEMDKALNEYNKELDEFEEEDVIFSKDLLKKKIKKGEVNEIIKLRKEQDKINEEMKEKMERLKKRISLKKIEKKLTEEEEKIEDEKYKQELEGKDEEEKELMEDIIRELMGKEKDIKDLSQLATNYIITNKENNKILLLPKGKPSFFKTLLMFEYLRKIISSKGNKVQIVGRVREGKCDTFVDREVAYRMCKLIEDTKGFTNVEGNINGFKTLYENLKRYKTNKLVEKIEEYPESIGTGKFDKPNLLTKYYNDKINNVVRKVMYGEGEFDEDEMKNSDTFFTTKFEDNQLKKCFIHLFSKIFPFTIDKESNKLIEHKGNNFKEAVDKIIEDRLYSIGDIGGMNFEIDKMDDNDPNKQLMKMAVAMGAAMGGSKEQKENAYKFNYDDFRAETYNIFVSMTITISRNKYPDNLIDNYRDFFVYSDFGENAKKLLIKEVTEPNGSGLGESFVLDNAIGAYRITTEDYLDITRSKKRLLRGGIDNVLIQIEEFENEKIYIPDNLSCFKKCLIKKIGEERYNKGVETLKINKVYPERIIEELFENLESKETHNNPMYYKNLKKVITVTPFEEYAKIFKLNILTKLYDRKEDKLQGMNSYGDKKNEKIKLYEYEITIKNLQDKFKNLNDKIKIEEIMKFYVGKHVALCKGKLFNVEEIRKNLKDANIYNFYDDKIKEDDVNNAIVKSMKNLGDVEILNKLKEFEEDLIINNKEDNLLLEEKIEEVKSRISQKYITNENVFFFDMETDKTDNNLTDKKYIFQKYLENNPIEQDEYGFYKIDNQECEELLFGCGAKAKLKTIQACNIKVCDIIEQGENAREFVEIYENENMTKKFFDYLYEKTNFTKIKTKKGKSFSYKECYVIGFNNAAFDNVILMEEIKSLGEKIELKKNYIKTGSGYISLNLIYYPFKDSKKVYPVGTTAQHIKTEQNRNVIVKILDLRQYLGGGSLLLQCQSWGVEKRYSKICLEQLTKCNVKDLFDIKTEHLTKIEREILKEYFIREENGGDLKELDNYCFLSIVDLLDLKDEQISNRFVKIKVQIKDLLIDNGLKAGREDFEIKKIKQGKILKDNKEDLKCKIKSILKFLESRNKKDYDNVIKQHKIDEYFEQNKIKLYEDFLCLEVLKTVSLKDLLCNYDKNDVISCALIYKKFYELVKEEFNIELKSTFTASGIAGRYRDLNIDPKYAFISNKEVNFNIIDKAINGGYCKSVVSRLETNKLNKEKLEKIEFNFDDKIKKSDVVKHAVKKLEEENINDVMRALDFNGLYGSAMLLDYPYATKENPPKFIKDRNYLELVKQQLNNKTYNKQGYICADIKVKSNCYVPILNRKTDVGILYNNFDKTKEDVYNLITIRDAIEYTNAEIVKIHYLLEYPESKKVLAPVISNLIGFRLMYKLIIKLFGDSKNKLETYENLEELLKKEINIIFDREIKDEKTKKFIDESKIFFTKFLEFKNIKIRGYDKNIKSLEKVDQLISLSSILEQLYKLMINSLFGKNLQKTRFEKTEIKKCKGECKKVCFCYEKEGSYLLNGKTQIKKVKLDIEIKTARCLGCSVLANSKSIVYNVIDKIDGFFNHIVLYIDTDSLYCLENTMRKIDNMGICDDELPFCLKTNEIEFKDKCFSIITEFYSLGLKNKAMTGYYLEKNKEGKWKFVNANKNQCKLSAKGASRYIEDEGVFTSKKYKDNNIFKLVHNQIERFKNINDCINFCKNKMNINFEDIKYSCIYNEDICKHELEEEESEIYNKYKNGIERKESKFIKDVNKGILINQLDNKTLSLDQNDNKYEIKKENGIVYRLPKNFVWMD